MKAKGAELREKMSFNERKACKNIYLHCAVQNPGFSPALPSWFRHFQQTQMDKTNAAEAEKF